MVAAAVAEDPELGFLPPNVENATAEGITILMNLTNPFLFVKFNYRSVGKKLCSSQEASVPGVMSQDGKTRAGPSADLKESHSSAGGGVAPHSGTCPMWRQQRPLCHPTLGFCLPLQ